MDEKRSVSTLSPVDDLLAKLLKPVQILVVDSALVAEEIAKRLERQFECEVVCAQPGTALKLDGYDLVLVDMSHQDALNTLAACRRAGIRAVLLVDDADTSAVMAAARQSAVTIVHKPVSRLDFCLLFQLFRLRAREKKDTAYFSSRQCPHYFAPA